MKKRWLAGLLAGWFLLPLGACGGGEKAEQPAMGRYVEVEFTDRLPDVGIRQILAMQASEESGLCLLAYVANTEHPDRWLDLACYRSEDGGESWSAQDITGIDASMDGWQVNAATWDSQGRLYLHAEQWNGDGTYTEAFLRETEEGTMERLPFEVPQTLDGSGLRTFRVADNGDLLVDCWWEIMHVDGESGAVKNRLIPESDSTQEGYHIQGNTAVLARPKELIFYDMEAGEETGSMQTSALLNETYSNSQWNRVAAYGSDGSIYYADATGIYRGQPGNSMQEQMVDGGRSSLGKPSFQMQQDLLVLKDRIFVVGWEDDTWRLLCYQYDPDVPTLPGTELRIWSMEEDPLLRQAIGVFQKANSHVYVSYEVGFNGADGVSQEDAIKALTTELLAGQGPDVLDLDGLPLSAYIEKGVLLDLGTLASSQTLLPNIAGTYLQPDGSCPAIPTQFSVPLLHGSSSAIAASRDLPDMVHWLKENRAAFNHPLSMEKLIWLLDFFAGPYMDRLAAGDRATLTEYLTNLKEIWDMEQGKLVEDGLSGEPDFNFGALSWSVDACGIHMGELCKFEGLYAAWQTSENKGDGVTDTLFGGNLYRPRCILGVNARSEVAEEATAFVETVLSQPVQSAAVGVGMPVNIAAFDATTQADEDPIRNGRYSTYGTTLVDKDGGDVPIMLGINYPPEEYRREWAERIKALDTPVNWELTAMNIIEAETADFFAGTMTLEATVERVSQKLELYRSERGTS